MVWYPGQGGEVTPANCDTLYQRNIVVIVLQNIMGLNLLTHIQLGFWIIAAGNYLNYESLDNGILLFKLLTGFPSESTTFKAFQ